MNAHRKRERRALRRLRDVQEYARRKRAHAPPHAVAHHRRGIARRFARFRAAGAGAFAAFLAIVGPGLLAGLSDDDPAGITTYSILGTDHGYRLLWIIPASTVLLVYFHLMAVPRRRGERQRICRHNSRALGTRLGIFCRHRLVAGKLWNNLRGVRGHLSSSFPGQNSIMD